MSSSPVRLARRGSQAPSARALAVLLTGALTGCSGAGLVTGQGPTARGRSERDRRDDVVLGRRSPDRRRLQRRHGQPGHDPVHAGDSQGPSRREPHGMVLLGRPRDVLEVRRQDRPAARLGGALGRPGPHDVADELLGGLHVEPRVPEREVPERRGRWLCLLRRRRGLPGALDERRRHVPDLSVRLEHRCHPGQSGLEQGALLRRRVDGREPAGSRLCRVRGLRRFADRRLEEPRRQSALHPPSSAVSELLRRLPPAHPRGPRRHPVRDDGRQELDERLGALHPGGQPLPQRRLGDTAFHPHVRGGVPRGRPQQLAPGCAAHRPHRPAVLVRPRDGVVRHGRFAAVPGHPAERARRGCSSAAESATPGFDRAAGTRAGRSARPG